MIFGHNHKERREKRTLGHNEREKEIFGHNHKERREKRIFEHNHREHFIMTIAKKRPIMFTQKNATFLKIQQKMLRW